MELNGGRHRSPPQDLGQEPAGWDDAQGGGKEGTNLSSNRNRASLHILRSFCAGAMIGIATGSTNRQL